MNCIPRIPKVPFPTTPRTPFPDTPRDLWDIIDIITH